MSGNTLWIYWAETVTDPAPPALDGLRRHPIGTWLAVRRHHAQRTSFRRAPNAGVTPQYGFAVDSDATHTYLFGNSNLLNLSLEGGYDNGPHSATQMYLARVPRGRFDAMPVYRTARGWSADPADAVPISERYWTENTMQPRFTGDGWVGVTKADGFWGSEVVIDVAEHPWGPWRTVATREVQTRYGAAGEAGDVPAGPRVVARRRAARRRDLGERRVLARRLRRPRPLPAGRVRHPSRRLANAPRPPGHAGRWTIVAWATSNGLGRTVAVVASTTAQPAFTGRRRYIV